MKKIFLFLAVASASFFASCSSDDDAPSYIDNDTYAESFEVTRDFTASNDYSAFVPLTPAIFSSDVVLVYRKTVKDGYAVWQQIPRTVYPVSGGEVDYDFNFDINGIEIFMLQDLGADLSVLPQYTLNQTFKIVLVPAFVAQNVDTNNIDAVMSAVQEYKNGGVPSIE